MLAGNGSRPTRKYLLQDVKAGESLRGTSDQERDTTKNSGGVSLWTVILVVKEVSSIVVVPPTRAVPCLGSEGVSAGVDAVQEASFSTSGLWSSGASDKWVEYSEGRPRQARAKYSKALQRY